MQTSFLSKMSDDKDASRELAPAIITEESQTRHPVYFFWKGANQFLLQGRVIIGPASETFFTYLFLLILALGTFIYYFIILPTLAQKFHLVFGFGFALCCKSSNALDGINQVSADLIDIAAFQAFLNACRIDFHRQNTGAGEHTS